tara:strand:+ start:424 stop:621 length:198 start_codon:yes stop_codon:yes gene_type:complete
MDRIISMILNRLMRQAVNRGIDAGVNVFRGRGGDRDLPRDDHQASPQNTGRARRMTRLARRNSRL